MNTLLHTQPDPKFQRIHYPLPDYLMEKFRSGLLRKIESGLAFRGFRVPSPQTRPPHPERPAGRPPLDRLLHGRALVEDHVRPRLRRTRLRLLDGEVRRVQLRCQGNRRFHRRPHRPLHPRSRELPRLARGGSFPERAGEKDEPPGGVGVLNPVDEPPERGHAEICCRDFR